MFFLQVDPDGRFVKGNRSVCKVTVNGADFMMREPIPFSSKWFAKKFCCPGLRHEVGVCIQAGQACWHNGPSPHGEWPDVHMSRDELAHRLRRGEELSQLTVPSCAR